MHNWFKVLGNYSRPSLRSNRPSRRRELPATIEVESLETRVLLSNYTVGTTPPYEGDSPGKLPPLTTATMNPLTSIPVLNSRIGAPVEIYLDFNGHTESQDWPGIRTDGQNGPIVTPVYDIDGDLTTYSDEELRLIEEIYYRVAEDFSPFSVNVTTVDPGTYNNFETIFVSIGGNGSWIGNAGGIAFVNSFNNNAVNTVYAFTDNLGVGAVSHAKYVALTVSHEAGHALGLLHHSQYSGTTKVQEYHPGTTSLGPIMGAPFDSEREIWDNGPDSNGFTSLQDDVAEMTRPLNQTFSYRSDDHGNTFATATLLDTSVPAVFDTGVIERVDDIDMFRFDTDAGPISFSADGLDVGGIFGMNLNPGTNLDIVMELYNANGVLLASSDDPNSLNASISQTVTSGTYYIAVHGTGQYGAIGQYTLTGTVIPLPGTPIMLGPTGVIGNITPTFLWKAAGGAASYTLQVDDVDAGIDAVYTTTVTTTSHQRTQQFDEGMYRARVFATTANGTQSAWSNYVNFTIDVKPPTQPILLTPRGSITDPLPHFTWDSDGAVRYELWVDNLTTGKRRIIYRSQLNVDDYVHSTPLKDGNYRFWVRAFNAVNESSSWSIPLDFEIDAEIPATPNFVGPVSPSASIRPLIEWEAVSGAVTYDLWVDNLTLGQPQTIRQQFLTDNFYQSTSAMKQGTYRAWVRAANANPEMSAWSPPYHFVIDEPAPATPTVIGPTGDPVTAAVPEFTWTAVPGAAYYDLWVNNATTQQVQIIREPQVNGTSFISTKVLPEGDYRAWVRAFNESGEPGNWSVARTFMLDVPAPGRPVITAPRINAAGTTGDDMPLYMWNSTASAARYEFWLDNQTTGQSRIVYQNGLTVPEFQQPTRLAEGVYVAWVRAENIEGEKSPWSRPYTFRVDIPTPSTPTLLGPTGTTLDRTPQFTWTHRSGVAKYQLLVRDLNNGENIILNVTSFELDPTSGNAIYDSEQSFAPGPYKAWVRAINVSGQASGWSTGVVFAIAASSVDEAKSLTPEDDVLFASLDLLERPSDLIPVEAAAEQAAEQSSSTTEQQTDAPVEVAHSNPAADQPIVVAAGAVRKETVIIAVPEEGEALASAMIEFAQGDSLLGQAIVFAQGDDTRR